MRARLVVVAVLGAGAIALWFWWSAGSPAGAVYVPPPASVARQSDPQVVRTWRRAHRVRRAAVHGTAVGEGSPVERPIAPAAADEDLDQVEPIDAWDEEAVDPRRARRASVAVRDRVEYSLPEGSEIVGVECRTTVCRARVMVGGRDAMQSFQNNLIMGDHNWGGPMSFEVGSPDGDGRVTIDCYFGEEDQPRE